MGANLKILYSSNAFWAASGYGVQGRSLLPRLAAQPQIGGTENIAMFAWYGLQGGVHEVNGFRIYPAGADAYGNDIIEAHTRHFQANVVVSLIDVWVMQDTARKVAPALWCPWLPIDHDPIPERVLQCLQGAHLPLTYSRWGHDMLTAAGVENVYIPHGIEPDTFNVRTDRDRIQEFKYKLTKDEHAHLSVMVAANKGFPDRKAFQVQLRAWAEFAKDKPHAWLYIHTEPTPMYGGLDLPKLVHNLGIANRVMFPDRYDYFLGMPPERLALMYNAADVYLGAAMAEGFGIPLIEAQACGVPVITTDFSAMPELVRWGMAVPPADKFWTPMNSWQAWPDVRGICNALEDLHAEWISHHCDWPVERRQAASGQIHAEYGWDTIVRDDWAPLLERLVADVDSRRIHDIPQAMAPEQNGNGHVEPRRERVLSVENTDLLSVA